MNANEEASNTTSAEATTEQPVKVKKAKAAKPKAAKEAKVAKPKAVKKSKAKVPSGTLKGPAILRKYAPGYHRDTEAKTTGGNPSIDSNDDLAKKLRGKPIADVYEQAFKVLSKDDDKLTMTGLKKRYGHLNVGMQRMNLGNRMRAELG